MKNIIQVTILLAVGIFLVHLSACSDDAPSATETNTNILTSHTWKMSNLKVDNTDQTNLFPGLSVTFSATGFTASNGAPVWPASGTWSFSGDDALTVMRSDGVAVTLQSISETQLVVALSWSKNTFGGGRVSSVSGNHVFTFIP